MHLPFQIFSPEEEIIDPIFEEKEIRLFIKRDDKIHPFISGNKWRKLKYQLEYAKSKDISHLVTFGGAWSNHLLACAAAAANFGFKAIAYVRGEEVRNPVLDMCSIFGLKLIFVDRKSNKKKEKFFSENHAPKPILFLEEGDNSKLGLWGG